MDPSPGETQGLDAQYLLNSLSVLGGQREVTYIVLVVENL